MTMHFEEYAKIPLFDQTKIDQLIELGKDIDEDVLSQLSQAHNELTFETLQFLSDGLTQSDASTIRKAAHKFKSSCGNLGFNRLQKISFDLELTASRAEKENQFDSTVFKQFVDLLKNEISHCNVLFAEKKWGAA